MTGVSSKSAVKLRYDDSATGIGSAWVPRRGHVLSAGQLSCVRERWLLRFLLRRTRAQALVEKPPNATQLPIERVHRYRDGSDGRRLGSQVAHSERDDDGLM